MTSSFKLDGTLVKFDRIDLDSAGARTQLVGSVDLNRWPEQFYTMKSTIDFPTQKAIWFGNEKFTVTGVGEFTGTFHMFKEQLPDRTRTGRELKGTFSSPLTGVNAYRFSRLKGDVLWTADKLLVDNATASLYGGDTRFSYLMLLGQNGARTQNTFDAAYRNVDLKTFSDFLQLDGLRVAGRATGHNLLEWPLGLWSEHHGNGVCTSLGSGQRESDDEGSPGGRHRAEIRPSEGFRSVYRAVAGGAGPDRWRYHLPLRP